MTNNPYPEYIGCLVAFETEDGSYYQGKLISIDAEERSITLDKPFKDGYPIREQVKLLGDHMKDLVVKKMPSPPPTPNMLEDDELENFLVYTPSDEVQSDLRPVQSSTVTFDQRFGKPQQNRQKNNNFGLISNNGTERKMAQWQTAGKKEPQMKKENVEKQQKVNGSNVKKNHGKENAKQEQKNDSRNTPDMKNPGSNEISLAFTKTVYNQEYMKNTENHNKEEPRGMKSLIEQAQSSHINVENVFEKLKISSHVKETPKNDQTGTSWYQNPLGGLDSAAKLSPELEKTLVDTLKVMNINISDSPKSAKKQNFMSTSRGKFQPAHENLQVKPRESEIEDPLKSLNLQPSGRKPVVIEIAQALSTQRKQQQQNLAQQSQLQNLTPVSPKAMPSYIKLSNTPDGPQVKPGRRYFMDAKEPKERNDKKNKNQKQSGSQYHKNSRVTVEQLLRNYQNLDHQQEKGCDKETLVSKENDKKNIKNKHDKNARAKIVRSEGSKNVEPETSSHSREQAFDMNFFGSPKSADGKRGGFVSNKKNEVPSLSKNIGQKSSKKGQEKEKTDQKPVLSMLFQEPAKGIEEKPVEPIKTPEPIAPSVANFFAQYSALKEEVVIKELPTVSQEEHATKIEVKNEVEEIAEPPNAGKIPIPLVDTENLAASSTADSLLNKLFSQFELQEVVKELKEELVSENQAVIDPLIPQPEPEVSSSGSESDTSSNASDEDQSSDETTNESDTTETDTESNSDAEIHSGAVSSSTSSQVSEKNEEGTDTEGSQEVPENPPHENLQNEGEAVDENLAHEEEISPQPRVASENVLLQEENLAQQATTSKADQSIAADPEIQIPENSLLADPKVAEILKKWPYNKLPGKDFTAHQHAEKVLKKFRQSTQFTKRFKTTSSYRVDNSLVDYPAQPKPRKHLNQTDMWFLDENGKSHTMKLNKH